MQSNTTVRGLVAQSGDIALGSSVNGKASAEEDRIGHISKAHVVATGKLPGGILPEHRTAGPDIERRCFKFTGEPGRHLETVYQLSVEVKEKALSCLGNPGP